MFQIFYFITSDTVSDPICLVDAPDSVMIYGYENKAISAGSTIVLTCVAMGGNPKADLTWYKGGKKVSNAIL